MNNELVIKADQGKVTIALMQDKRLSELHSENGGSEYNVGDLYLGKVKKLATGLNAAFVNVGYERDGFLHYLDLGRQFSSLRKYLNLILSGKSKDSMLSNFKLEPDIDKNGRINKVLSANQTVLVQIAKEPISTKGPRITSEITLAGRFLVLMPFSDRISISQRIKDSNERNRLRRLIQSIKPEKFGVIIRTIAEKKKVAELDADMKSLVRKWETCYEQMKNVQPPKKVLGEIDRTSALLRDVLNPTFNSIHVNDAGLVEAIKDYIRKIAPDKQKIVKLYKGKADIFDHYGIAKQIKGSFGKYVTMPSGAYLVVEHTEALHVFDVNSGNTAKSEDDQETNALRVNLEAADEIARQLRLRDMGGIIVVDFIDLQLAENRKKLYQQVKDAMSKDRAKHNILPPSRFGLIQITRQRVRPEVKIQTREMIPTTGGGEKEVEATILLIDRIETDLDAIIEQRKAAKIKIQVHPFIDAYLKKGFRFYQRKWFMKSKKWVDIVPSTALPLVEYYFYNGKGQEISI